jgi:acetolactate synthase-1/2/3 large subunit
MRHQKDVLMTAGSDSPLTPTVAEALLGHLARRGVDLFLANAGTDFPSIIESLAKGQALGLNFPRALAVAHETPLVALAHGFHLATGRVAAAMVHVGVGTANALGPLMAAARARIPLLLLAGRTPLTEAGRPGSRTAYIQWGQECFDQAGMVREFVKWDYELKGSAQLASVLDRALALAQSQPQGPVYLTLPREILAAPASVEPAGSAPDPPAYRPDRERIRRAAALLAQARRPLVITSALGRRPEAADRLAALAERWAWAVVSFNPEYLNLPLDHPGHQGFDPVDLLPQADVVLVLDCDAPWYPHRVQPCPEAVVIQAGPDPLFGRYPLRGFPAHLSLAGETALILDDLDRKSVV